ncbi:MAG: hypothetical protein J7L38_02180 [Thermoproteales archaeon]|nr:hypothetical protein [Thermoproteales archaeon]RLE67168.1 MAG: hypothetical protein DRJ47_00495 [Thermoprotei archaeon]
MQHEKTSCEICGREVEEPRVCMICGRKVCEDEFDSEKNICLVCLETLCQRCGTWLSIAICNSCGRHVCEACSVKVGAGYLCLECAEKRGEN